MKTEDMIPATEFCIHHNITLSLIYSLNESGLIEIIIVEAEAFLQLSQLSHIEKLLRLYEMDINVEGLETINHLLQHIADMQQQMVQLHNKLSIYEG